MTYKTNPDVFAVQGYDAAQLLQAGLLSVKGDLKKKDELYYAMAKTTIASPRGKLGFSAAHNPIQDFYAREAKGNYNVITGVAAPALADPARGCKM